MGKTTSEVNSAQGEAVFAKKAKKSTPKSATAGLAQDAVNDGSSTPVIGRKKSRVSTVLCLIFAFLFVVSAAFNIWQFISGQNSAAKDEEITSQDEQTVADLEKEKSPTPSELLTPEVSDGYINFPAYQAQIKIPKSLSKLELGSTYGLQSIPASDTDTEHGVFCITRLTYTASAKDTTTFTASSSGDPDDRTCIGYTLNIYSQKTYKDYIDDIDYATTDKVYENDAYVFFLSEDMTDDYPIISTDDDYDGDDEEDMLDALLKMYKNNIQDYKEK